MRTPAHLTDQALLLHLATELAQSLLELLRVFDDYLQTLITPFLVVQLSGSRGHDRTIGLGIVDKDNRLSRTAPMRGVRRALRSFAPMAQAPKVRTKHAELSLEEIGSLLPGTGEIMASVSTCFGMCWHAAAGGNWDLGAYYLRRVRGLLRGLSVTRPKYADRLRDFDTGVLEQLYQALLERDRVAFERLYEEAVARANANHAETGYPYVRWRRPPEPPEKGLDLGAI